MLILEDAALSSNMFVKHLATFFLLLAMSAMRFEHLQKATIAVVLAWAVVFAVLKGKAREGVERLPMRVGSPRHSVKGTDLYSNIQSAVEQCRLAGVEMCSLLPDFAPATLNAADATAFVNRKMPQGKALGLLRSVLGHPRYALDWKACDCIGVHSARHVLPSLADFASCNAHEKLLVGAWRAEGDEKTVARAARRAGAMPARYSAVRPVAQAEVKLRIKTGLLLAMKQFREKVCPKTPRAPAYEDLAPWWPAKQAAMLAVKQFMGACEAGASTVQAACQQAPLPVEDRSSDDDSSSSSSTSDEVPALASKQVVHYLEWAKAKGSTGRLHLRSCDGSTACGRVLRTPIEGDSMPDAMALGASWSPRCWELLPQLQRDEWSNMLRE